MGGATNEEVANYRRQVKAALLPAQQKFDKVR